MDYVLKQKDFAKYPNQFRVVDSVDGLNGGSIGVVWREFISHGDTTLIPRVKGFVSRGSNIYILVSDTPLPEEFNFISWIRIHSGKEVSPLTYKLEFPGGSLPRPIGGVLEELADLHSFDSPRGSTKYVSSPPILGSSDEPLGTVLISEGIWTLEGSGYSFVIPEGGKRCQVGSSPDNDFVLKERGVSRVHAIIRLLDDTCLIKDNNSTNGIKVNGVKLEANTWVPVDEGSSIKFGSCTLKLNFKED